MMNIQRKRCMILKYNLQDDWNLQRRQEQTLAKKLSNIASLIPKNIISAEFKLIKEKLQLPTKEGESGLYTWETNSPFYTNLNPIFKNTLRR